MTQWQDTDGKLTVDWDAVYAKAAEIDGQGGNTTQLVREVRNAALEEAAKVADNLGMKPGEILDVGENAFSAASITKDRIAAAIRALK
jgi:hypothetical protein